MNSQQAAETYRVASVESAPPVKIIRLLYQGALRFLDQARSADPNDPSSGFPEHIAKVDAIVSELRLALDPEHDPEVCERLEKLYLYVEDELGRIAFARTHDGLDSVRAVLVTLLDAWTHVEIESTRVAS